MSPTAHPRRDEAGLIREIVRLARRAGVADGPGVELGIGHDCAVLAPRPGEAVAWHVDDQVEGIHFRLDWASARDVGWKAAGSALSDLAAVGARPLGVQLALELPRDLPDRVVLDLVAGFTEALAAAGAPLVGGNIAARLAGSGLSLSVSVAGAVRRGRAFRRDGGRAGDGLYLSGPPGLAHAGLERLEAGRSRRGVAVEKLLRPRPRIALGQALARLGVASRPHAATDTSDGLAVGAINLAAGSGLAAVLDHGSLRLDELARAGASEPLGAALHGGEDYELLVAAPAALERTRPGRELFRVGELVPGRAGALWLRDGSRRTRVTARAFAHRA